MRKTFAAAVSVALVGGLALTAISGGASQRTSFATLDGADARAAAQRATKTYEGEFKPAGKGMEIRVKAQYSQGEAKSIKRVDYDQLRFSCSVSGNPTPLSGGWTLTGVNVNNRRKFRAVGDDGESPPSTLKFTGKFNRSFNKVRGKFQTTVQFGADDPPVETCASETYRYSAKR